MDHGLAPGDALFFAAAAAATHWCNELVGCARPVRVQTRPGETLTGSACIANDTVQEYAM